MSEFLNELNNYKKYLNDIENPQSSLNCEKVLKILLSRDKLDKIAQVDPNISIDLVTKLIELDEQLNQQSSQITKYFDLVNKYKKNNPSLQHKWWWQLDQSTRISHPWNRFDNIMSGVRLSVWTFNIALLGTLVSRLIGSNSGIIGALAIAVSTFIPILQAKTELTESGKKSFNNFLSKFNIPQYLYEEVKLASTLVSTLLLLFLWHFLPLFVAEYHYRVGAIKQRNDELKEAEKYYLRAIELNPNLIPAYDYLGYIYDVEWHDLQKAEGYYFVGVKGEYISSYSHLGRLYLLNEKQSPYKALIVLEQGLQKIGEEQRKGNITEKEMAILFEQQYSLYKNMGWAKLQQGNFEEAGNDLETAKKILETITAKGNRDNIKSPGAVYCLLAQLPQNSELISRQYWQECQNLIEIRLAAEKILPEEHQWLSQSKKILQENNHDSTK